MWDFISSFFQKPDDPEQERINFRIVVAQIRYNVGKIHDLYDYANKAMYNSFENGKAHEIIACAKKEHRLKKLVGYSDEHVDAAQTFFENFHLFLTPTPSEISVNAFKTMAKMRKLVKVDQLDEFFRKYPPPPEDEVPPQTIDELNDDEVVKYIRGYAESLYLNERQRTNLNLVFPPVKTQY